MIKFKDLVKITGGTIVSQVNGSLSVSQILTDSRRLTTFEGSVFFAINGDHHNGHEFIETLIEAGVQQFVVDQDIEVDSKQPINILKVADTRHALQQLAKFNREQFKIPVVGITGSNGKTIVKEWLRQLLSTDKIVVKSPASYNSQIGVPLSVFQIEKRHEIGIFEAGISKPNEMISLERIIQPTIGIFTNIGTAHNEGFNSEEEKIKEKAILFQRSDDVIYCKDHTAIDFILSNKGFTWGESADSDIRILTKEVVKKKTKITLSYQGHTLELALPFTDEASIENAMHCITFLIKFGYQVEAIQKGINKLSAVKMRLELKRGINGCLIIDDSYNNDLGGLNVALDFLNSQSQLSKKTLILSDLLQTGLNNEKLYQSIVQKLSSIHFHQVIAIGTNISKWLTGVANLTTYVCTDDFLNHHDINGFNQELILLKGARPYAFEKISKRLEEKIHGTQLEINLNALTHNLNYYRSKLAKETKIMVMVKAFAYGSGSLEIANLLQHHRVDYLGVAYADEGVVLRKNGISIPIMVMNPTEESFEKIKQHELEPEIYNLKILKKYIAFIGDKLANIHLKIDTGMRRLGFKITDVPKLIEILQQYKNVKVKSIFSHLAGADEAMHNDFSEQQATSFIQISNQITSQLAIDPLLHLVNSAGIIRFPQYHFGMVRLGIGLYGIEASSHHQEKLQPISTLKTIVSQINYLKKGETVGYSRKGVVKKGSIVATIAIGYADGFSRAFSNGIGHVSINGRMANVIGNVCMDMTMVDITHIEGVKEGDHVEVFGKHLTITEVANQINTIPYEILTNVSQRVKRVYYAE